MCGDANVRSVFLCSNVGARGGNLGSLFRVPDAVRRKWAFVLGLQNGVWCENCRTTYVMRLRRNPIRFDNSDSPEMDEIRVSVRGRVVAFSNAAKL